MSILKGVKVPRKKKRVRSARDLDLPHVGAYPDWDDIDDGNHPEFANRFRQALRHYSYFNTIKDMKKYVIKFLSEHAEFSPADVKLYKLTADWRTSVTTGSLCAAIDHGMPVLPDHKKYILAQVHYALANLASDNPDAVAPKKVVRKITIQDRMKIQFDEYMLHFEEMEDGLIDRKEKCPEPEAYEYLKINSVPIAMLGKMESFFQVHYDELLESKTKDADESLKEGYAHLKRNDVKRFSDFYSALLGDIEMYREEKKVARKPRLRKAPSKEKQIGKLKYQRSNDALKLVSINPADIIDASVLWVYNTKTRKFGTYYANSLDGGFGVKGTTITGFDTSKSVAKTLRKPVQQLAAFKKVGKVKLRTFLNDINAVAIKLNGRINKDVILLKTY